MCVVANGSCDRHLSVSLFLKSNTCDFDFVTMEQEKERRNDFCEDDLEFLAAKRKIIF